MNRANFLSSLNELSRLPSVLGIAGALCLSYSSSGEASTAINYLAGLVDGFGLLALAVVEMIVADIGRQ